MIKIGLLGAVINNNNLGCVSLTVSLLKLLETLKLESENDIEYVIFDESPDVDKTRRLLEQINIYEGDYILQKEGKYGSVKSIVRRAVDNIRQIAAFAQCDFVIDLTQGDSFTDMYGEGCFWNYTRMKKLVLDLKIPLILGPQTFGPFRNNNNQIYAKKVIERANLVIARDVASYDYLTNEMGIKGVELTTDLAFGLTSDVKREKSDKTKLGINISGLLVNNKVEMTPTGFELNVNYDTCMLTIVEWALEKGDYEIHIIPHVVEDYEASINLLEGVSDQIIIHEVFNTPFEAKKCIAEMDIFIGARMHATIAAFSSGIATIPLAYSRKFTGLFDTIHYPYVIDLQREKTDEASEKIINLLNSWVKVEEKVLKCNETISKLCYRNKELIKQFYFDKV